MTAPSRFPLLLFLCLSWLVPLECFTADEAGAPPWIFYSVKHYGASGDGKQMDTQAIQAAIGAAAEAGGGTVYFPAGTYLSATLFLKNRITLHLEAGATLLGSPDPAVYPETRPKIRSYTDNYVTQSLIYGEDLEDVAITGRGAIDGQGAAFQWKEYRRRPYIIRLISCRNVLIEGVTLRNSAMWMQHYLACENLTVRGISVFNHVTYNNDGIDVDGCRAVRIADCVFDSDDDALCLKSTTGRPTEDVTITNCVLSSHCNAFKMGTESNGGFTDITATNCVIRPPRYSRSTYGNQRGLAGIALEIVDGGALDRVSISHFTMQGISAPIFLRLGNRARPYEAGMPKPAIGSFQNVQISHITATGVSHIGCSITGLPEGKIKHVTLSDLDLEFEGGGTAEDARRDVPLKPEAYPESSMFGVLPAYGFYCRDVEGLTFRSITLRRASPDARPALVCGAVRDLVLEDVAVQGPEAEFPALAFQRVENAWLRGCRALSPLAVFLRVSDGTRDVSLTGCDLRSARNAVEFDPPELKTTFFESSNHLSH
ncbi:MAG: glycoside hydrolase family 28 protein [bacterium]